MTGSATRLRLETGSPTASGAGHVRLGRSSVSISRFAFLGEGAGDELRAFLDLAFSVGEVRSVDLDRRRALSRIRFEPRADLAPLLSRLGRAFRLGEGASGSDGVVPFPAEPRRQDALFLDAAGPVRVTRIGRSLSTFRIRVEGPDRIRIAHPLLGARPEMRFRLQEELAALPEVQSFRPDRLSTAVAVRLQEPGEKAIERLARALELAWPRLLDDFGTPPSVRALAVAGGLLALSVAGTLYMPALLPVAAAGIVLNGLPNAVRALADLGRGRIGVPALRATGLAFFLLSRAPLSSAFMATLNQLWPKLAYDKAVARQHQLLAPYRIRPRVAWLVLPEGGTVETPADALQPGDLVAVRRGERVPADGTLERGLIATTDPIGGAAEPTDKEPGDAVRAGERIVDGEALVRIERPADRSAAALIERQLPHGLFPLLPAAREAERVADRNAKPALAVAFYAIAARRGLRPARAVIRPDYLTAARLSAQLGAQEAFVDALRGGVLFRRPAAIERLGCAEVFVFDDSAPLVARPLEIGRVVTDGIPDGELLAYAAAAFGPASPAGALLGRGDRRRSPAGPQIHRRAGYASYEDPDGRRIEVASEAFLNGAGKPRTGVARSVWILCDGERLGRIDFRHGGPRTDHLPIARFRAALPPSVELIHVSEGDEASATRLGAELGLDGAIGGLDPAGKAEFIRSLGRPAAWIGDGTAVRSAAAIAASSISLSTAAASDDEQADAVLLRGLEGVLAAWTTAGDYRAAVAQDYRLLYAANLAGAAGGLMSGFSSLHAGLLSNAATAAVYARHARRLRRMAPRHGLEFESEEAAR